MKKISTQSSRRFKYGGYAVAIVVLVIVAVVLANIGVSKLGDRFNWDFDMTRNHRFTLSATSRQVAQDVEKEIVLYAVFSESQKDSFQELARLVENFAYEGNRIRVEYVKPSTNPRLINKFIGGTVSAINEGDIIVSRADESKFKVLDEYDLYSHAYSNDYSQVQRTAFRGEEALANAILFVDSDVSPKVYWLTGHDEGTVNSYPLLKACLEAENYVCSDLSSSEMQILEQGDVLIIAAPKRDINEVELKELADFAENGGRVIYLNAGEDTLPNFEELFEGYGVKIHHQYVGDANQSYVSSTPLQLVPSVETHDITSSIRSGNYAVFLSHAEWLELSSVKSNVLTVTPILMSSPDSYAKSNPEFTAMEKETGDVDGPFVLAAAIERPDPYGDTAKDVRMLVVSTPSLFLYGENGNYGNVELSLQTVRWMQNEESKTVNVISKSLLEQADRLYIRNNSQAYLAIVAIFVPAVLVLAAGIVVWLRRRHL